MGHILSSYLHERKQCTKVGSTISLVLVTTKGIPQGSVLSPFLFNYYVLDLNAYLQIPTTPQFVDDTSILVVVQNLLALELKSQVVLDKLAGWSYLNSFLINHTKTKYLIMFKRITMEKLRLVINNQCINEVNQATLLGLTIQNSLKWDIQASKVIAKLSQVLGFVYRNVQQLF